MVEDFAGMDGVMQADFGNGVFAVIPFNNMGTNVISLSIEYRKNADFFVDFYIHIRVFYGFILCFAQNGVKENLDGIDMFVRKADRE